jgi:hypothetical protein
VDRNWNEADEQAADDEKNRIRNARAPRDEPQSEDEAHQDDKDERVMHRRMS